MWVFATGGESASLALVAGARAAARRLLAVLGGRRFELPPRQPGADANEPQLRRRRRRRRQRDVGRRAAPGPRHRRRAHPPRSGGARRDGAQEGAHPHAVFAPEATAGTPLASTGFIFLQLLLDLFVFYDENSCWLPFYSVLKKFPLRILRQMARTHWPHLKPSLKLSTLFIGISANEINEILMLTLKFTNSTNANFKTIPIVEPPTYQPVF